MYGMLYVGFLTCCIQITSCDPVTFL